MRSEKQRTVTGGLMLRDKKIAFLGGGNMAEALIKGLIAGGTAKPDHILVTDVSADRLAHLHADLWRCAEGQC